MKARAIATVALLGLLAGCAPSTSAASTATVTADEQRTGLSGRAEVPEGTGMLFTFAGRQERQVWMAGMQTRIDAAWIDVDELLRETGAWSGGERRLVRIAASLLGGPAVDLSEDVPGLDRQAAALVLAAIAHANGSHEHSEFQFNEDGTPRGFSRVPTLYPWPETR